MKHVGFQLLHGAVLALLAFGSFVGCGDNESSSAKISGTLQQGDYQTASRTPIFDKIWATLVEGMAFAAGLNVSELWALPLESGEFHPQVFTRLKRAIPAGGSFSLDLERKNWVVLLVDSTTSSKKDQVVGYLTMSAEDSGMTSFPLGSASGEINLGTLSQNGDETESSRGSKENAPSLALSVEQIEALALSDDSIKTVKNAYRNYDNGKYFSVRPFFNWYWDGSTGEISNSFSSVTTLVQSKFQGYLFYMDSNSAQLNFDQICSQATLLTLEPPTTVQNHSQTESWGPGDPLTSAGANSGISGKSCGVGSLYLRDDTASYGSYAFNFSASSGSSNEYLRPPIPVGDWTVRAGSQIVGEFESNIGTIFENDDTAKPTVFMPSLRANVSGGTITSIDVKWYLRDPSTGQFNEVTDATILNQMSSVAIGLTDYSQNPRREERSDSLTPSTGYSFTPSGSWSFTGDISIDVSYTYNNMTVRADFRD